MWAMGYIERPTTQYQIYRYKSLDSACMSLAELMANKGPYDLRELTLCAKFLIWLEEQTESDFENHGGELAFLELPEIMFVVGKYENITQDVPKGISYKIIQDHRDCTPAACFGDIAERN